MAVSCCAVLWRELLVSQAASSAAHSSSPVITWCLANMGKSFAGGAIGEGRSRAR
jgi:hypothetical protein